MSANFRIKSVKIDSSLLLHLSGDFDGTSAWELVDAIMAQYGGSGEVVIHIENLRKAYPFGVCLLENLLTEAVVPTRRVLFVDGKRVLRGKEGIQLLSPEESPGRKSGCGCDGMCDKDGCDHSKRSFDIAQSA
jgi:hypothetical protein